MKPENKKIKELLRNAGINDKLKGGIKPSKHPTLKLVEDSLMCYNLAYEYFIDSDCIVIMSGEGEKFESIHNTMIMPSSNGINILIVCNEEQADEDKDRMIDIASVMDEILPSKLNFSIIGVL
tara:strand:- start:9731 stop:10099 length:369 start_codon:yes stop_codon:yes gene_type:complete